MIIDFMLHPPRNYSEAHHYPDARADAFWSVRPMTPEARAWAWRRWGTTAMQRAAIAVEPGTINAVVSQMEQDGMLCKRV